MTDVETLIRETMKLCEDFPVSGIGKDGASQDDLDKATAVGHPMYWDDTYHRAQQIWLNLNAMLKKL